MSMNITLSISGDIEEIVKTNNNIKWTEIARQAIKEESIKIKKLSILQKYMEKKPITDEEWKWMDKIDWHPVDEMEYQPKFIEKVLKKKELKKGKNIKELFE